MVDDSKSNWEDCVSESSESESSTRDSDNEKIKCLMADAKLESISENLFDFNSIDLHEMIFSQHFTTW